MKSNMMSSSMPAHGGSASGGKKAHFIGICGVGMSATAALLKELGYEITGSCTSCYPPVRTFLEEHNMLTYENHARQNVPEGAAFVVGGASAALDRTQNEEVDEAHVRGIPVKTFPEILEEVTREKENIVIAGSYGKTTCTTLVTWLLRHAGKDPGYFIGALVPQLPAHGHVGEGPHFVIEGDEYPTSGIDNRSKFLLFPAHDVLLVSADHDHVNKFPTHESYLTPFRELLKRIPPDGTLVVCSDNALARNLAGEHTGTVVTYGIDLSQNPDWSARNIVFGETTTFDLYHRDTHVVTLETSLLGKHNVQNIVGAAAMVLHKNVVTPEAVAAAIKDFEGITRRLDKKTEHSTVEVYEGFGSSREKAMAAIDAMRTHLPGRRLLAVFEPHTFSWRNHRTLWWYDDVFRDVDKIFVYHPAEIGAAKHDQVSHEEIIERIKKTGKEVVAIHTPGEGIELLTKELKSNDILLLLTSGNLDGLVQEIPKLAEKLFPKE